MNGTTLRVAILLLLPVIQSTASASEYRGADWGLLFLFHSFPFALIPIVLSGLLTALGAFRIRLVFWLFFLAAAVAAAFFLLFAFRAPGGAASAAIVVAEVLCVLVASLVLPWRQQSAALQEAQRSSINQH